MLYTVNVQGSLMTCIGSNLQQMSSIADALIIKQNRMMYISMILIQQIDGLRRTNFKNGLLRLIGIYTLSINNLTREVKKMVW